MFYFTDVKVYFVERNRKYLYNKNLSNKLSIDTTFAEKNDVHHLSLVLVKPR